jgi:hypothetical protein
MRTALPSDDYPVNSRKSEVERTEERLTRQKANCCRYSDNLRYSMHDALILDRNTEPDVRWHALGNDLCMLLKEPYCSSWTLREDLVNVPIGLQHDLEYSTHERIRDIAVEEVRHGIDKDHSR